eukprot:TRINITY_DN19580_c0_g1_i1.p1 TRINITY_DN19580_c0_g1~~TRINITY_DN19580_c0_g1_i1.p1  ORF type:complete len:122 (+),score=33.54 TRINITY_DN19580_c0_g1_i1:299-664(+)
MTYLNQYQYIPYERLQEMMMDYFNIPVGDGTIEASSELMYKNLEETEAFIKQELINSKVNHNDESGIRCEKKKKKKKKKKKSLVENVCYKKKKKNKKKKRNKENSSTPNKKKKKQKKTTKT